MMNMNFFDNAARVNPVGEIDKQTNELPKTIKAMEVVKRKKAPKKKTKCEKTIQK